MCIPHIAFHSMVVPILSNIGIYSQFYDFSKCSLPNIAFPNLSEFKSFGSHGLESFICSRIKFYRQNISNIAQLISSSILITSRWFDWCNMIFVAKESKYFVDFNLVNFYSSPAVFINLYSSEPLFLQT